jgi:hypothetical protein
MLERATRGWHRARKPLKRLSSGVPPGTALKRGVNERWLGLECSRVIGFGGPARSLWVGIFLLICIFRFMYSDARIISPPGGFVQGTYGDYGDYGDYGTKKIAKNESSLTQWGCLPEIRPPQPGQVPKTANPA